MKVLSQSDNQVDSRFSLGGGNTIVALVLGFLYSVHQIENYSTLHIRKLLFRNKIQIIVQKNCGKTFPNNRSENSSENCPKNCQKSCQKKWKKKLSKILFQLIVLEVLISNSIPSLTTFLQISVIFISKLETIKLAIP